MSEIKSPGNGKGAGKFWKSKLGEAELRRRMKKIERISCVLLALYAALSIFALFLTPKEKPFSVVLYGKDGSLLGAQTSIDGQWHFETGEIPEKFEKCIINYEDSRYYYHFGIDIPAIARAAFQNARSGRIVSGGSTITMQTARILLGNKKRTYLQKAIEMVTSVFLEIRYSKKKLLQIYCSNAPYGGNVIGLEAASWRYYNRPPESLSWAECATLAVLPNQPSLVMPGTNSEILMEKRNALLLKLKNKNIIDDETYSLSLQEILPSKPYPLPKLAPHYLEALKKWNPGEMKFFSSIDSSMQKNVLRITESWSKIFQSQGIKNAAVLVIDTKTKEPLAYVGNINSDVDMIQSQRSPGSLLKPFLYGAMLDNGMLLQNQLVIDIPTRIGNYAPENNVPNYSGALPANQALTRSLNIPAIRELRLYGITPFLNLLGKCGFTTLTKDSDYYGLSLILGGGEVKMIEIANAYARMMDRASGIQNDFPLSQGASYLTLNTLSTGIRPDDEANYQRYGSQKKIAWKTGTSSGNRDAWCVGVTSEYTVVVWGGNSSGEGNKNLTSAGVAAPLMFDIFSSLPSTSWPPRPEMELSEITICEKSGYLAGVNCVSKKTDYKPSESPQSLPCPYCRTVSLTPDGRFHATVNDLSGEYEGKMPLIKNMFVLPPYIEYWYTKHTATYEHLPPFAPWHKESSSENIQIAFPELDSRVIVPTEIDGKKGAVVFQAASSNPNAVLYWDLDGEFLGFTEKLHSIHASPSPGRHTLTITDNHGGRTTRGFWVEAN